MINLLQTPIDVWKKLGRIYRNKSNRLLKNVWMSIQQSPIKKHWMFYHARHLYTALRYRMTFGEWMDMQNPRSLHEKLFWLSVNYQHPLIMQCADKYRVREYVDNSGCGDILNELYGVYDRVEEIPFSSLPDRFVIKNNRGSGDNFFCTDKSNLDIETTIALLSEWKDHEYGVSTAEYQYIKIPFKLVCEKYLLENEEDEMMEYQFFCFNGQPVSILVRNDLETSGKQPFAVSYSLDWKREYLRKNEESFMIDLPVPTNFEKMKAYAQRLAAPFPHVRVDFYEVAGKLYFGELTFSTHGNVLENYKDNTLEQWTKLLTLPKKYCKWDRY